MTTGAGPAWPLGHGGTASGLLRLIERANDVVERAFRPGWRAALFLIVLTGLIRLNVMGDPNYHVDEAFYLLVAQRMHAGAVLYIDIWDRKPPGIYLIYYAISAVAPGILAVHIAAAASVALAGILVYRVALLLCGPRGAMLAAVGYVALMGRFGGAGGQSPVFYNTLMIGAVWLIASRWRALCDGRLSLAIVLAMLLAGAAITVKPVALPEAVLLGLTVLWASRRTVAPARLGLRAVGLAAVGAAPMLACAAWYWSSGHFADLWDALVLSNFRRRYLVDESWSVLGVLAAQMGLVFGLAALSAWFGRTDLMADARRRFLYLWLVVAVAAFLAFPNKADHYVLPLAAPLMICAAPFLDRRDLGLPIGLYMTAAFVLTGDTFSLADRADSRRSMAAAVAYIHRHDPAPRLLVYAGSPTFYSALGAAPMTPLAFSPHLFDLTERDVSRFNTRREVERVLSLRPTTVVMQDEIFAFDENLEITRLVKAYVAAHCRRVTLMPVRDMYTTALVRISTECGA